MPGPVSDPPSVSLSFANNFWGKDDAGVTPLLDRMHGAKTTGEELKAYYTARLVIEDEYARKLLSLARKPLGSSEAGTLRMSLDVVRGETESMGKAHQNIAHQMKTELDEPLTAFAGGMRERRKIVQGGIEKLLKVKNQQTAAVNKARDRYEQDCLKIKGYLAQGHMVMGQEERKNKAKLEKTQIQLSSNSHEYEAAVRALEETTVKWNKDWKAGCDKFQDLEEERIDFMKSSLWTFANIASTVCVSDDASCEKIRLSLEDCEVEKDIASFIRERGTGQEIPESPKYIDFCREDVADAVSESSDDGKYSVAQFQRTTNPTYRSASPQPSMMGSQHDPSEVSQDMGRGDPLSASPYDSQDTPRKSDAQNMQFPAMRSNTAVNNVGNQMCHQDLSIVPHNEYPMDGMTQFCRLGQPSGSEVSSSGSPHRPSSRDSQSDYSNPTSFSSHENFSAVPSPTKQMSDLSVSPSKEIEKKRGGFFQNRSPFRRKSKSERDHSQNTANKRSTWAASSNYAGSNTSSHPPEYGMITASGQPSASPEPVDPRANFQLNVGNNVFDVASPDAKKTSAHNSMGKDGLDPIAQALAELKGVTKESSVRMSADRYAGVATPGPGSSSGKISGTPTGGVPTPLADRTRNTPSRNEAPPSYNSPSKSMLGAPQPAFTSKQMQQTTQRYTEQKQNMFNSSGRGGQQQSSSSPASRPGNRSSNGSASHSRATSPVPMRSTSPRPGMYNDYGRRPTSRAVSPNPYGQPGQGVSPNQDQNPTHGHSVSPLKSQGYNNGYSSQNGSPGYQAPMPRAASPALQSNRKQLDRPNDMAAANSMAGSPQGYQQQPRARTWGPQGQGSASGRPMSQYGNGVMATSTGVPPAQYDQRSRGKSVGAQGGVGQLSQDGRPVLHFARAMYMYRAAIPEELSFAKTDLLAVLRKQDDGWWEAEVVGKRERPGLVPSNYLVQC